MRNRTRKVRSFIAGSVVHFQRLGARPQLAGPDQLNAKLVATRTLADHVDHFSFGVEPSPFQRFADKVPLDRGARATPESSIAVTSLAK